MKYLLSFLLLTSLIFGLTGCTFDRMDYPADVSARLDNELFQLLDSVGGSLERNAFVLPLRGELGIIPQDSLNPLSPEKVKLGRHLYHETGMAVRAKLDEGMYTYSCASCHHVDAGFQAGVAQGIGEGGLGYGLAGEARIANPLYHADSLDVQPIRTPSVLNIAYQENVLWNGQFGATGLNTGTEANWLAGTPLEANFLGYEGVETQAIAGLTVHRMDCDPNLVRQTAYKALFDEAFPSVPVPQRYDQIQAGLAIAAYERTLLASEAPFQRWLKGDSDALNDAEKEGALLFFGKAGCVSCHNGPALNSMAFYGLGMNDLSGSGIYAAIGEETAKLGRGGFTVNPEDNYKFKVPQLYNLKDSPFYGHGATFQSVFEVISYKNEAVPENTEVPATQLAPEFKPLGLSRAEIATITMFVENALYDDNLKRFVPLANPSGMCFPNADSQSKKDLDCQ